MGRSDIDPEFVPIAPVVFDDPIAEGDFEREGALTITPVEVCVYRQDDGAIVVQIDYQPIDHEHLGRVRVNVNDGTVFDRNIESNVNYGDDLHDN